MLRFSPNIVSLHDLCTIYSTITDVEAFLSDRPRLAEAGVSPAAATGFEAPGAGEIDGRPERLPTSFHGRDLFAPVAAHPALGGRPRANLPKRHFLRHNVRQMQQKG
jgi:hypothetical protein